MNEHSTPAPGTLGSYAEQAAAQDELLDRKLAVIRRQLDAGDITVTEAASLRVQALEAHIAAIRALRIGHFGSDEAR